MKAPSWAVAILYVFIFIPRVCLAADDKTENVFKRFSNRVVQIRVMERSSNSKSVLGSGFLVSADGLIITNYHVVSSFVLHPDEYRIEVLRNDNKTVPWVLLGFDVVHDLAIGKIQTTQESFFTLTSQMPIKGVRVFSMGNPLDLGQTIVEGTYSGLVEKALYEKLHFTGSLNPGMSGGPAITRDGNVLGINVASAGEQISFLVPAKFAQQLIARFKTRKPDRDFLIALRDQLFANQESYISKLKNRPMETVDVGEFRLPGQFSPVLKCWGNVTSRDKNPYKSVYYVCSAEDRIFVSNESTTGSIAFRHVLISNKNLNMFQFASLVQGYFESQGMQYSDESLWGAEDEVTNFECTTQFIKSNNIPLKAALCLRAYKKMPNLYDAVFEAVTLSDNHRSCVTSLAMTGISVDNARALVQRYLDKISWQK